MPATQLLAPAPRSPGLRHDRTAQTLAGIIWLLGLGYFLGVQAPRDGLTLLVNWFLISTVGLLMGLALRNLPVFVLFSAFGAVFFAIYAAIRL